DRVPLAIERPVEDQRDLGLHSGLQKAAGRRGRAVVAHHIAEQHAEIRLRDAELALHGFRRQPDLASCKLAALREPALGVDLLDRISRIHIGRIDDIADRRTWRPRAVGIPQPLRRGIDLSGHDCPWALWMASWQEIASLSYSGSAGSAR